MFTDNNFSFEHDSLRNIYINTIMWQLTLLANKNSCSNIFEETKNKSDYEICQKVQRGLRGFRYELTICPFKGIFRSLAVPSHVIR